MIICPEQGFVFVHIPKCAGSSVRSQIVKCDPAHIARGDMSDHPVLGQIDLGHIPLSQMREHFPEDYAYVRDLPAFAVVRDPLDRFGSALRQVLWQYEQRPMTLIPPDELREKTLRLLDDIEAEIDNPSYRLIFFARQTEFVFDGEDRLVDHLIPIDLVADFLGFISQRTNVPLDTGARANQNVDLRFKWLGNIAYRVNGVLWKVLPKDAHARIKDAALRILANPGKNAANTSGVLDLPEVRDFVAEHYRGDQALFDSVTARKDEIRDALVSGTLEMTPAAPEDASAERRTA